MTRFLESEALLAVIRGEEEEAERLVAQMLPNERRELAQACNVLNDLARNTHTLPEAL